MIQVAYFGKNDQGSYYVNSIRHGFKVCNSFSQMMEEARKLQNLGFYICLENKKNLSNKQKLELKFLL